MKADETGQASRTERKKEETRRKIVASAVGLIRQFGFNAVTMEQIAEEADVAKGTLYNYYRIKEAILADYMCLAFQTKNDAYLARLNELPDTRTRLTYLYTEMITGIQTQMEIFEKFLIYRTQSILSLQKSEAEQSGMEQFSRTIIRLGQAAGEIRRDLPDMMLEDFFEFALIEIAKQCFLNPTGFAAGPVVEAGVDLYLNGVRMQNPPAQS